MEGTDLDPKFLKEQLEKQDEVIFSPDKSLYL